MPHRRTQVFATLFTWLLLAVLVPAWAASLPLAPEVRTGTLPNGLTYYVRHHATPPGKVELRLAVNAGSILEDDDQRGLAHFAEHMSFNGTKHFPRNELVSYLQSVGVAFGADVNAYTNFDETVYMLSLPVDQDGVLDRGLEVLRDWAGGALLTEDDIKGERGVVLAEWRTGKGAQERVMQKALPAFFNGSRYGDRLPIGTEESLRNFDPAALRRFYHDWYRPDLLAVVVVGDVDAAAVEQQIRTLFADAPVPPSPRARPARFDIPPRESEQLLLVTDPELSTARVDLTAFVRPLAPIDTMAAYRDAVEADLVDRMLDARLQELADAPTKPFLAAQASQRRVARGWSAFALTAALSSEQVPKAVDLLVEELARARRYGFTAPELARAKRALLDELEQMRNESSKAESSDLAGELVNLYLNGDAAPGAEWEYRNGRIVLDGLNLTNVNARRARWLGRGSAESFVLVSGPPDQALDADALRARLEAAGRKVPARYKPLVVPDRLLAKTPKSGRVVGRSADADLGTTTLTFANGVRVVLKPTTFRNDEIQLQGVRAGGYLTAADADHFNTLLLPATTEAMGFGAFTPTALRQFLQTRQADANVALEPYSETVRGGSSRRDFETMLQLVVLKMTEPRFDMPRFESHREQMQRYLASLANSPDSALQDAYFAAMSQDHPRAQRVGKPQDYDRVDPARSVALYRERFGDAGGFTFVIAGRFEPAVIEPLLVRYLGGLPGTPHTTTFTDRGIRPPDGHVERVVRRGVEAKAVLIEAVHGDSELDARTRLELGALSQIAGFRVTERIREALGSAYSPSVGAQFERVPVTTFLVQFNATVTPDDVAPIGAEFERIAAALRDEGPTAAEVEKAQAILRERYRAESRTNGWWLDRLAENALWGELRYARIPFNQRVDELTPESLRAAAQRFLDPANVVRVVLLPEAGS